MALRTELEPQVALRTELEPQVALRTKLEPQVLWLEACLCVEAGLGAQDCPCPCVPA